MREARAADKPCARRSFDIEALSHAPFAPPSNKWVTRLGASENGWLHFFLAASLYLFAEKLIIGIIAVQPETLRLLPAKQAQQLLAVKIMYECGYTRLTTLSVLSCSLNLPALDDAYAIACCSAWGVLLSRRMLALIITF